MIDKTRNFLRDNSQLFYFLIAQAVVLIGAGASVLTYFTRLDVRVTTMEVRGAQYTVARMDEMKLAIARLEQGIDKNEEQIKLIREVMTRRLNINP